MPYAAPAAGGRLFASPPESAGTCGAINLSQTLAPVRMGPHLYGPLSLSPHSSHLSIPSLRALSLNPLPAPPLCSMFPLVCLLCSLLASRPLARTQHERSAADCHRAADPCEVHPLSPLRPASSARKPPPLPPLGVRQRRDAGWQWRRCAGRRLSVRSAESWLWRPGGSAKRRSEVT